MSLPAEDGTSRPSATREAGWSREAAIGKFGSRLGLLLLGAGVCALIAVIMVPFLTTRPPTVRFVVGDLAAEGLEGSSTWRGIARDRLLKPPETWVPVNAGTTVRFQTNGPPPNETFLTVYQASSVADGSMAATAGIDLDPRQPSWVVDLLPGRYVITLSRTWGGSNSVSHSLGIEVHGFDAV